MHLADEWRIPCQSLLISGDGFEPGYNTIPCDWQAQLFSLLILILFDWINPRSYFPRWILLFKIPPALQLLLTASKKRWRIFMEELVRSQLCCWEIPTPKTHLCWSMNEQLWSYICHLMAQSSYHPTLKPQGHGPLGTNISHVRSQSRRIFLYCVRSLIGHSLAE